MPKDTGAAGTLGELTPGEELGKFMGKVVEGLYGIRRPGEYASTTFNATNGDKEGPVIHLSILPATTGENAKAIQQGFIAKAKELSVELEQV